MEWPSRIRGGSHGRSLQEQHQGATDGGETVGPSHEDEPRGADGRKKRLLTQGAIRFVFYTSTAPNFFPTRTHAHTTHTHTPRPRFRRRQMWFWADAGPRGRDVGAGGFEVQRHGRWKG